MNEVTDPTSISIGLVLLFKGSGCRTEGGVELCILLNVMENCFFVIDEILKKDHGGAHSLGSIGKILHLHEGCSILGSGASQDLRLAGWREGETDLKPMVVLNLSMLAKNSSSNMLRSLMLMLNSKVGR